MGAVPAAVCVLAHFEIEEVLYLWTVIGAAHVWVEREAGRRKPFDHCGLHLGSVVEGDRHCPRNGGREHPRPDL